MDQQLNTPYQYQIKNEDIAAALAERGFSYADTTEEGWVLQAPDYLSATKAKKVISTVIKLYATSKEITRAWQRYEELAAELERLDG